MRTHVEIEHGEGLDWHQWVFLGGWHGIPATVKRDLKGRHHRNAWRDWLVLSCNNSECPARGLVLMESITDVMQGNHPVPVGTGSEEENDGE